MKNKIDSDKIRLWRKERYWSQEQVAEKAGISLRTIQRLENGGSASYDSAVSLANVFEVDVNDFLIEDGQFENSVEKQKSKSLMGLKMSFGIHAAGFVIGMVTLLLIDLADNPSEWSLIWPIAFLVIGIVSHGAVVYMVEFIEKMKREIRNLESAG
ncbi:MAG: helix-turn-helix domain-containing protein [Anaerolineae bacterium]|nr:helix-turn-helix domain-containing protein [Anaerolineae bacterium]